MTPVLDQWRAKTQEMDQLAGTANLSIKHTPSPGIKSPIGQTSDRVSTDHQVLSSTHGQLVSQFKARLDKLAELQKKLGEFAVKHRDLTKCLSGLQETLAGEVEVHQARDLEPLAHSLEVGAHKF